MNTVEVKFSEWIQGGIDLYKENFRFLVLAGLVSLVVGAVPFGLLIGPMQAGFIMVVSALLDKQDPKPVLGDVFRGFDVFLNAFLYALIWGLVLFLGCFILGKLFFIGPILSMAFLFALSTFLVFGLHLIADENLKCAPATEKSIEVVRTNYFPFLGFITVTSILGGLGTLALGIGFVRISTILSDFGIVACSIGIVLTYPLLTCIVTVAYRDVYDGGASSVEAHIVIEPESVDHGRSSPDSLRETS